MEEASAEQIRREVLNRLHTEGGQVSWQKLSLAEYQELEKMAAAGLIERVAERGDPHQFTYRLKSVPQEESE